MSIRARYLLIVAGIICWLGGGAWAGDSAGNAATLYRQACAQLPYSSDDQDIYMDWGTVKMDGKALDLIHRCQPVFKLLRQASSIKNCDWQLDYNDPELKFPDRRKLPELDRACAVAARSLFEQGKDAEALDLMNDLFVLSRQLGQEKRALVFWLIGDGVREVAISVTCAYLPTLSPPGLAKASEMIHALPAMPDAIAVLRGNQSLTIDAIRQTWTKTTPLPDSPLANVPRDPQGREKLIAEMQPLNSEAARIAALPPDKAQTESVAFGQKLAAASAACRSLVIPDPEDLASDIARSQEETALMAAAVAVVKDGRDALKPIKDPLTGGPFEYSKIPGGFRLISTLLLSNGRHASVDVGPQTLR